MWNTFDVSNQGMGSHLLTADSTDVIAAVKAQVMVLPYFQNILQTWKLNDDNYVLIPVHVLQ